MYNVACIISGSGSFVSALAQHRGLSPLRHVRVGLVIADRECQGLVNVTRPDVGVPRSDALLVKKKDYPDPLEWGERVLFECQKRSIDILGLYGCLSLMPANVVREFRDRSVNAHPGPLDPGRPDFGGEGMYGLRVHHAVMQFNRKARRRCFLVKDGRRYYSTSVVAHRVTKRFDQGAIIGEEAVGYSDADDTHSLSCRALSVEHSLHIRVLAAMVSGQARDLPRTRRLIGKNEIKLLETAKRDAIEAHPPKKK